MISLRDALLRTEWSFWHWSATSRGSSSEERRVRSRAISKWQPWQIFTHGSLKESIICYVQSILDTREKKKNKTQTLPIAAQSSRGRKYK